MLLALGSDKFFAQNYLFPPFPPLVVVGLVFGVGFGAGAGFDNASLYCFNCALVGSTSKPLSNH